jgi:GTPase SAR1 family protein
MGICTSESSDPASTEAKLRSEKIDREIKKSRRDTKVLLLGPGESGKSTIFKQMKILQDGGGFSEEERLRFKPIVYSNCISQMRILVTAAQRQNIPFDNPQNAKHAQDLLDLPFGHLWSPDIGSSIQELWNDSGIRNVYTLRDKSYQLNDTADYFFDNVNRFKAEDYIPSVADVLRVRVRSTGIEEAEFVFDGMVIKVVDVGGQRSERRKWIHCFSSVTSILFCASLSGYCQNLREKSDVKRMEEALELFSEVANSDYFHFSSIILFLNKVDLFARKLKEVPLNTFFPNYEGEARADIATEFVKARFVELAMDGNRVYTHITCALDSENIEHVIYDVRASILENNIIPSIL